MPWLINSFAHAPLHSARWPEGPCAPLVQLGVPSRNCLKRRFKQQLHSVEAGAHSHVAGAHSRGEGVEGEGTSAVTRSTTGHRMRQSPTQGADARLVDLFDGTAKVSVCGKPVKTMSVKIRGER
jgi:hypothetical protein